MSRKLARGESYLLEKNGFPAGKAELLPSLEPLLEIEMSRSE